MKKTEIKFKVGDKVRVVGNLKGNEWCEGLVGEIIYYNKSSDTYKIKFENGTTGDNWTYENDLVLVENCKKFKLKEGDVVVEFELDDQSLGAILKAVFGNISSATEDTTGYKHTYTLQYDENTDDVGVVCRSGSGGHKVCIRYSSGISSGEFELTGDSWLENYLEVIDIKKYRRMTGKLNAFQKLMLSEEDKALVEAGYLDTDLSLTEKGKTELHVLQFAQHKKALVERAKAEIEEETKASKKK